MIVAGHAEVCGVGDVVPVEDACVFENFKVG